MARPACGTAILHVPCDRCGRKAVARYVDDGHRLTSSVACTRCWSRVEFDYAPGHAAEGAVRDALLAQSGHWRTHLAIPPGTRDAAAATLQALFDWPRDRTRDLPTEGEALARDGTYGECYHAARLLEHRGHAARLEHVAGALTGLHRRRTKADEFADRWRKAAGDARFTSKRCPHCDAPRPSYRRTCKVCLKVL